MSKISLEIDQATLSNMEKDNSAIIAITTYSKGQQYITSAAVNLDNMNKEWSAFWVLNAVEQLKKLRDKSPTLSEVV